MAIDRDARTKLVSVPMVRERALRRLPRMISAYVESVADDGAAWRRNREGLDSLAFVPRTLTGAARPDISTEIAGARLATPVMLAPTGIAGFVWPHAEVELVKAADAEGTLAILSTAMSTAPERAVRAAQRPHWFQLYTMGDQDAVVGLCDRARACGFTGLVVTVDTQVLGKREAELASGLSLPMRVTPRHCLDVLAHPRWALRYLGYRGGYPALYPPSGTPPVPTGGRNMQADLHWRDLRWLRDQWQGPLFIKGVMHADDALRAVEEVGVDGVILSNHGGRQLGSSAGPIEVLPQVRERIGGQAQILIDGGILRGSDVVKAICLGADAVLIGRAHLYGLAIGGADGVRHVLQILAEEMRITMTLLGCRRLQDLDRSLLHDRGQL